MIDYSKILVTNGAGLMTKKFIAEVYQHLKTLYRTSDKIKDFRG